MAVEFYDLLKTPVEVEHTVEHPASAELVKELTAELEAGWRAARPKGAN